MMNIYWNLNIYAFNYTTMKTQTKSFFEDSEVSFYESWKGDSKRSVIVIKTNGVLETTQRDENIIEIVVYWDSQFTGIMACMSEYHKKEEIPDIKVKDIQEGIEKLKSVSLRTILSTSCFVKSIDWNEIVIACYEHAKMALLNMGNNLDMIEKAIEEVVGCKVYLRTSYYDPKDSN